MNTAEELRELDAYLALHVMGFQWRKLNRHDVINALLSADAIAKGFGRFGPDEHQPNDASGAPHYTTDPAAALTLLEKCITDYPCFTVTITKWPVGTDYRVADRDIAAEAPTLPAAICFFARKLYDNNRKAGCENERRNQRR